MSKPFEVPSIHRAGWPFIALFAAVTAVLSLAGWPLFVLGTVATLWCAWFFRDPVRVTPVRSGLIVSPADGKVIIIDKAVPPAELDMGPAPLTKISVFLNVFDVHINRVPADGVIEKTAYHAGKFLHAAHDKASEDNERMAIRLRLTGEHPLSGASVAFVQIAGLVARRIVCEVRDGQEVLAGQRYGLIRFGSRADIYLPDGVQPLVTVGQYVLGGESVLADCTSLETARQGAVR